MSAPIFLQIDQQMLNVNDIKWVGVKDTTQEVSIEFISGGFTALSPGISLGDFEIALNQAIKNAAPF